jgi:hypothetical protein
MTAKYVHVEGIAASTHLFESRYGPTRLDRKALEGLAKDMVDHPETFNAHHDPSQAWRVRNVQAWIEPVDDQEFVLRFSLEVLESDHDRFLEQASQAGVVTPGFSFAHTEVVGAEVPRATVTIAGDAADFDDDELLGYAKYFDEPLEVRRLYQYAAEAEIIRFVLELAVAGFAWDGFKFSAKKTFEALQAKATSSRRRVAVDIRATSSGRRNRVFLEPDGDVAAALEALQRIYETGDAT